MNIEHPYTIDAISINVANATCTLTIVDHLKWDRLHLDILQAKINYYLRWIETGEIYLQYPHAAGFEFRIHIAAIFAPDESALAFLARAQEVLNASGFHITVGALASNYAEIPQ